MADSLPVLVPHQALHATVSILVNDRDWWQMWACWGKQEQPAFISKCPGNAQSAAAQIPGDHGPSKPALFHKQSMRLHAILHQQVQPW